MVCKYTAAFKASVVEECRQTGVTKAEIARKYGIHSSVIYRWVKGMGQIESVGESVSQPEVPHKGISAQSPRCWWAYARTSDRANDGCCWLAKGFHPDCHRRTEAATGQRRGTRHEGGIDSALARVVAVFGAAHPHCAYVFANKRTARLKVLMHDGLGICWRQGGCMRAGLSGPQTSTRLCA